MRAERTIRTQGQKAATPGVNHDAPVVLSAFLRQSIMRKWVKERRTWKVARSLLTLALAMCAMNTMSCVIPPDLKVDTGDAGPGATPIVQATGPAPEFLLPGPVVLDRGDSRTIILTVAHNDDPAVLYARMFVDYERPNNPEPAYASCQAPSTGERTRVIACPAANLCNPIDVTDNEDHVLEAMVADREFIDDGNPIAQGQPQYRALREPSSAQFSLVSWIMRCNPPEAL